MSFGSATSRARGNTNGSNAGGGGGGNWDREREELKRDYEYRIANLTGKLGQLEGGVESAKEGEAREREGRERAERDMDAVKEVSFSTRRVLDLSSSRLLNVALVFQR